MDFRLEMEETGRLHCEMTQGGKTTAFSAYDGPAAISLLEAATGDLARDGCGECYWQMASGEYRLLFRRTEDDAVRIAVLWANGIVTGWEHVFWAERPIDEWMQAVGREIARARQVAE